MRVEILGSKYRRRDRCAGASGLSLWRTQSRLRERLSHLRLRRAFSFLVRKPGFAPGPSASRAEMLLLHHNPVLNEERRIQNVERTVAPFQRFDFAFCFLHSSFENGAPGRTRTDEYEFTKLAL